MTHEPWELDRVVAEVSSYIDRQKAEGIVRFWIEIIADKLDVDRFEVLAAFAVLASRGDIENCIRAICSSEPEGAVAWDGTFAEGFPSGQCRSCGLEISGEGTHSFDIYARSPGSV